MTRDDRLITLISGDCNNCCISYTKLIPQTLGYIPISKHWAHLPGIALRLTHGDGDEETEERMVVLA